MSLGREWRVASDKIRNSRPEPHVRYNTVYKASFFTSDRPPKIFVHPNPTPFMRSRFLCLVFAFLSAALCLSAQTPPVVRPAPAEPAGPRPALPAAAPNPAAGAPAGADEATINGLQLSEAPIDSVLQLLESFTGRTVLRPQNLPTATYSINITRTIPKEEAVRALETLLGLNQIGVVPLGDKFLKVIPLAQSSREAPEMITGSTLDLPPSGRIAAKLFQLQFLNVNEIIPMFQQIMSPGVQTPPMTFPSANAALIVDSISNLQRIELLLKNIDQPLAANLAPKFYTLQYAKASDLVNKLHTILQGPLQAQLGSSTTYTADDRTNQIILISDSRQYAFFDDLIAKLDIKSDPNTRNEVIYLKHALAKDVSSLLSSLISGQTSAAQKTGQTTVTPGQPTQPNQPPRPNIAPTLNALGLKDEGTTEFSSFITVVPDDRSNSIVVSGTGDDIRLIQNVVDKIDILLAQVSIQVIIAEVDLSDTDISGLQALNFSAAANRHGGFDVTKFAGSVGDWAVTNGTVSPAAFTAALNGNGASNRTKILSADTITTTHAKEADFVVSTNQPIITGTTSTPTGAGATPTTSGFSTSSSVTYQNIGIEVKVTPLIGNDGSIQLTIDQKVDSHNGDVTIDGNTQPIIDHREATSYVNVQDGQMVVLGGLQQHQITAGHTKLGWLWEIPVLSNILGQHKNDTERKELLFFVRPHVIAAAESNAYTSKRVDELPNKDDINQFLKDSSKQPKQSLIDKYYKE
jgi:general secretion pathway protein D